MSQAVATQEIRYTGPSHPGLLHFNSCERTSLPSSAKGVLAYGNSRLIAETTLTRTYHLAKYHPASPILEPNQPWEMKNPGCP